MATPYTADQLRQAIRERIGYDSTTVIGDTELLKMLNDVIHDVWDILIKSDTVAVEGPVTTSTVANTRELALANGLLPYIYRLKRLALRIDGYSYPLETFELGDRVLSVNGVAWGPGCLPRYRVDYNQVSSVTYTAVIFDPPPDGVYTIEYWYNGTAPVLTAGSDVPFALGFPVGEYIILECAIRCLRRLRMDTGELMADRDRYLQRIEQYFQPEQRERAPMALRTRAISPFWGRRWH